MKTYFHNFSKFYRYGEDFEISYTDFDDLNNTRRKNETLKLGINHIPLMYETEKIKLEYVPKPTKRENALRKYLNGKDKDPQPTKLLQDSDRPVNRFGFQFWGNLLSIPAKIKFSKLIFSDFFNF